MKLKPRLHIEEKNEEGMVLTGSLVTKSGKYSYAITHGIPRFVVEEDYAHSFGREWETFPQIQFEASCQSGTMSGHTERMFRTITEWNPGDLKNKVIVEFGSGAGRFLDVIRTYGGIAIGLELTAAADVARNNFKNDPDVLIVQGDALSPPFVTGVFDYGFSIGVLHHTPAPEKGFSHLTRVIKKNGKISACVYEKNSFYDNASVFMFRKLIMYIEARRWLKKGAGLQCALWYSYFSAYFLYYFQHILYYIPFIGKRVAGLLDQFVFVWLDIPDSKWRVLDVFDAITPFYASTHTSEQVAFWFISNNCQNVRQTKWCSTSFTGEISDKTQSNSLVEYKICVESQE